MQSRTDAITASRVDLALILMPLIGIQAAARMLAHVGIPDSLALRVLIRPTRRRQIA
jgi:hypothetical protein